MVGNLIQIRSWSQKQDAVTGGFLSSACSWRDIVARELHRHVLSPAEDCLFVGLGRWNKEDERVPVKILFPEITVKRLGSAGCSNFPDASLFPEAFGRDILVASTVLPVSEVACGVELVERGVMCGPSRPCEVPLCLHGGSSQKLWLAQVRKEFHVLCGDQRPLFRLAFIGVVPDAGWLVEAPHFWSMVREVVDSMAIRILLLPLRMLFLLLGLRICQVEVMCRFWVLLGLLPPALPSAVVALKRLVEVLVLLVLWGEVQCVIKA